MTLKIEKSTQRGFTVFALSGRMEAGHIVELEKLFGPQTDYSNIILDLSEIRLADRAAVGFFARCEAVGAQLENCPAYIREWMGKEGRE
jgi:hypothetical protein